jgi:potassium/chloride transporter 9
VNDPRRQYKLIQFCNSLKKGALFVLGHVIVSQDFGVAVPEARRQQQSWTKYIDFSRIKAFVNIAIAPTVEWGARNILLGAGLGGMRPNIVIMGFYNLGELRQAKHVDVPSAQPSRPTSKAADHPTSRKSIQEIAAKRTRADTLAGILPTDAMKPENAVGIQNYVTIVEDLVLRLQINVALAKGFQELEVPAHKLTKKQRFLSAFGLGDAEEEEPTKKYIDMWPIQMSAEITNSGDDPSKNNALTTNFDTYTLILQLGCILHTVPSWKRTYKLRVIVFVEYETDIKEEQERVTTLLRNLRIEAEVLVFSLASGTLKMYEVIINGRHDGEFTEAVQDVDDALEDEEWWSDIQKLRRPQDMTASQELANTNDLLEAVNNWPTASFQHGRTESHPKRFRQLRKMLKRSRKMSLSNFHEVGTAKGMGGQRSAADSLSNSGSSSSDDDQAEDEAIATESEVTGSEDIDEYDLDASDTESDEFVSSIKLSKSASSSATGGIPFISNFGRALWGGSPQQRPTTDSVTPLKPHPGTITSDSVVPTTAKGKASRINQLATSSSLIRPPPIRHQSMPKFTSKPLPRTAVASEETSGPSIMFVDTPPPSAAKKDLLASSTTTQPAAQASSSTPAVSEPLSSCTLPSDPSISNPIQQASGYPSHASIPLSFNDLPCRAQHLILNELIRSHSDDTAVVFTTLPSPVEGTSESEEESVKYVSDLEVLCQGLPPVLLVHSNSMTVTMNL